MWYLEKFHPSKTLARDLGCSQNWDWRIIFHLGWGSGKAYSFNQKTPEEEFRAINRENIIGGGADREVAQLEIYTLSQSGTLNLQLEDCVIPIGEG